MDSQMMRFYSEEFVLDQDARTLKNCSTGKSIQLSERESALLSLLIHNQPETVSYNRIQETAGIRGGLPDVQTHMSRLRNKLEDLGLSRDVIEFDREKRGYRFNRTVMPVTPQLSIAEYVAKNGQVTVTLHGADSYEDWKRWLSMFRYDYRATRYVLDVVDSRRYKEEVGEIQKRRTGRDGLQIDRWYLYANDVSVEYENLPRIDEDCGVHVGRISVNRLRDQARNEIEILGEGLDLPVEMLDLAVVDEEWVRLVAFDNETNRLPTAVLAFVNDSRKLDAANEILTKCDRLAAESVNPRRA